FFLVNLWTRYDRQILIPFPDAPLSTIGMESVDRNAHGNACIAPMTVRTIDQIRAPPEAESNQARILRAVEWITRVQEQHRRCTPRQIAAPVRYRQEYRQFHFSSHCSLSRRAHSFSSVRFNSDTSQYVIPDFVQWIRLYPWRAS